jgi:hypothetical protein
VRFASSARPARFASATPPARFASAARLTASLLALARWVTPDLPLYGNDHDRGDFAP